MKKEEKYICFHVGEELFIIPLKTVTEIFQISDVSKGLKLSNNIFLGNYVLGAQEVPLINMSRVLNRTQSKKLNIQESCIIKLNLMDGDWGIWVDSLEGIIKFKQGEMVSYSEPGSPISGKAYGVKRSYFLLDPEKIVSKLDRLRWGISDTHQLKAG